MRRTLIAGNWKLNGSKGFIKSFVPELNANIATDIDVAICAPYIYLPMLESFLEGRPIGVGAQDVSMHLSGAYTGEISAGMLKQFSCHYCLVGHSERRDMHNESDLLVAMKLKALKSKGITPILCVGESLEDRDKGMTDSVIEQQLLSVINECGIDSLSGSVIAYEPIWAIGTGRTASPEQAQEVHVYIREVLQRFDVNIAEKIQILYGGSMNASNASSLLAMPDVDGGLVGGASLEAEDFLAIYQAAQQNS